MIGKFFFIFVEKSDFLILIYVWVCFEVLGCCYLVDWFLYYDFEDSWIVDGVRW